MMNLIPMFSRSQKLTTDFLTLFLNLGKITRQNARAFSGKKIKKRKMKNFNLVKIP